MLAYASSATPEPLTSSPSDSLRPSQLQLHLATATVVTEVPGISMPHCMNQDGKHGDGTANKRIGINESVWVSLRNAMKTKQLESN